VHSASDKIAQKVADAVKAALVSKGIADSRITIDKVVGNDAASQQNTTTFSL
jgi:outer membrane protein OmpA-like peptidoglycan-associated protein